MTPSDDDRPLEPDRLARLEDLLGRLERVDAPEALRPRVASALGDGEDAAAFRVASSLVGLDRRPAPESLRDRVARELAPDEREFERRTAAHVARLGPVAVPDELRERVRIELSSETPIAELLGGLERQRVPPVLERLVAEEMVDEKAHVRRFVGSLPKPGAPAELVADGARPVSEGRVLRGHFGALRVAAAAVLLVGAGVVLWSDRSEPTRHDRPAFRLEHRVADSVDALEGALVVEYAVALGLPPADAVLDAGSSVAGSGADSTDDRPSTDGGGR